MQLHIIPVNNILKADLCRSREIEYPSGHFITLRQSAKFYLPRPDNRRTTISNPLSLGENDRHQGAGGGTQILLMFKLKKNGAADE